MCVQSSMIVLEGSHLGPCVLSCAHLEIVKLIRVGNLDYDSGNGFFEASANDFKAIFNCEIVIVYAQLRFYVVKKLLFLVLRKISLLEKLIKSLAIQGRLFHGIEHYFYL